MRIRQLLNGLFICGFLCFLSLPSVYSQDYSYKTGITFNTDSVLSSLQKLRLKIYSDFVYWENVKKFNPYTLSIFWKESSSVYMPHKLNLIYKMPQYKPIEHKKTIFVWNKLKQYNDLIGCRSGVDSKLTQLKMQYPLQEIMQNSLFNNADFVKYKWVDIPEPHKFVDRGYLDSKKSEDELRKLLLSRNEYDTKRKIQKLQRKKTPWVYEGIENIQISQVYLSNWAKGGESSLSILSDLRVKAIYKMDKYTWENYVIHKIGFVGQEESKGRINDDVIELNSKFGLNASEKWYYSGYTNFKTQFFNGYSKKDAEKVNPLSAFMSPAYWTFAVGMDYKIKKHKFTFMISPLTSKLTMVLDTSKVDQTRYRIPEGKKIKALNGGSVVNNFSWKINNDFHLSSRLSAFYEYFAKNNEAKQVHFEWEAILNMRINVWLSTRLLAHLRYFSNESDKMQFKENLSLSFRYIIRYKR